jgi:TM2 domain-containing membrane protein YozV
MNNLYLKQDLTSEQLAMVESEMNNKRKSKGIAYALWFFLATFGGHRFYLGNIGYAICMILFGWATLFLWNLIDVFFIGKRIDELNNNMELEIITKVKALTKKAI